MNKKETIKFLNDRLKESESYKKSYDLFGYLAFPDDLSYMSTLRDIDAFKAAIHYISNNSIMDIEVVNTEEVIVETKS